MGGTSCLKSLATKALERLDRNKTRNRIGTNDENLVPQLMGDGTRNSVDNFTLLDLKISFEERLAICEYDGGLDVHEATKIALEQFSDELASKLSNLN